MCLQCYGRLGVRGSIRGGEIINKFDIIIGDKWYDSEENHVIAKRYGLFAVIPARNEEVPIYHMKGENRKRMKRHLPEEYKRRV